MLLLLIKTIGLYICVFGLFAFSTFAGQQVPCWLNKPTVNGIQGYIGVASPYSAQPNGSLIASRRNAIRNLNIPFKVTNDDLLKDTLVVSSDLSIRFLAPEAFNSTLYTLAIPVKNKMQQAIINKWSTKRCDVSRCHFERCSPSWLCDSLHHAEGTYVISMSQRTANPKNRFRQANKNAQRILNYLGSSHVDAHMTLKTYQNKQTKLNVDHAQVTPLQLNNTHLVEQNLCHTNDSVFVRFLMPHISYAAPVNVGFQQWRIDPTVEGRAGVVGYASLRDASGLLSAKIKRSIKNGLIDLAQQQKVHVTEHAVLHQTANNIFYLSQSEFKTNVFVSAELVDIRFIPENSDLAVYTWLLPKKTHKGKDNE